MATPIDRVPSHVKTYLWEWRNANNQAYLDRFAARTMKDLTIYEIEKWYREVTQADTQHIGHVMQQIETEESRK